MLSHSARHLFDKKCINTDTDTDTDGVDDATTQVKIAYFLRGPVLN